MRLLTRGYNRNGISDVNRSEILLKSLKEGAVVGNYREDVEEINKTFTIATKRWKKLMIESLVEGLFPEFLLVVLFYRLRFPY